MRKLMVMLCVGLFLTLGFSPLALAIPTLQLDLSGGTYGGGPDGETVLATTDAFTLYALLNDSTLAGGTFHVSASVYPLVDTASDLGSFVFGGTTYDVTGDMMYGTPSGLPTHGAFPTYYLETAPFNFLGAGTVDPYNTQDDPGGFADNYPGSGMYFRSFDVDVSGLTPGTFIHFDLYGMVDGKFFKAPFSHDAQSNGAPVPEPTTVLLLGLGLVGVAGLGRKRLVR